MSHDIGIFLDIQDSELKVELGKLLSKDSRLSALAENLVSDNRIAVTDNPHFPRIDQDLVILAGDSRRDDLFSSTAASPQELLRAIKRAFCHIETRKMNMAASHSVKHHRATLEEIAKALAKQSRHLSNRAEMRLALVEQMPAAAAGIDEQGFVVLLNSRAKLLLNVDELQPYGTPASEVFPPEVCAFLNTDEDERLISLKDKSISIRKSQFNINGNQLGSILVFWE